MFKKLLALGAAATMVVASNAETYFKEEFGAGWESRWVQSDWKKSDGTAGTFAVSAGSWYGDKAKDAGLQTTEDARFYATSAQIPTPFSNAGKDLVFQFSVKHEQNIDCGGGYFKLLPASTDQKKFNGDSEYFIMFGPDICGSSTRRVHAIFNYKGQNLLTKKDVKCETDQLTHTYTLVVHADKTYEIKIDNKVVESGSLEEHWDFLPPKTIKDPNQKKPADWVDAKLIADPNDKKPADWDEQPAKIVDPDAVKPDDWSEEDDGEWEAPMIPNPEYKGDWKPKMIPNPAYKGEWVHPLIANPEYQDDASIGVFNNIGVVGMEIWQVKAGTVFDNIIVTDSVAEAEALYLATDAASKEAEKKMFENVQAKKAQDIESARVKHEQEEAHSHDEDDEEDDDDEDDEVAEKLAKAKKPVHEDL